MEILSDATFKGNIELSANKHLTLLNNNNTYKSVDIIALSDSGSLGFFFNTSNKISGCFYIRPTSDNAGRRLLDERDICGKVMSRTFPINFDVSADCSKFVVPGPANSAYAGKVHSAQMLRTSVSVDFGQSNCLAFQPLMADIYVQQSLEAVLVHKSTSFAISSTDGYQIDVVYS